MTIPFRSLTFLALALAAAPAQAADVALPESDALDWSGPWVGVLGGAGRIGGDGGLGGVAAGHALQFEQIVVGVEGDVSGAALDARRLGGRYEIKAFGTIRARIGYAFDRFVAYGSAGVAFASAEFGGDDRLQIGWTAGAGFDVALTTRLSARAEWLYVDLDRKDFAGVSLGPAGGLARLGLNYRF
jgi:outer membrane immunogenic protein